MSEPQHSFVEERRGAIMDMLDHASSVQVAELARTFGVSAVTIRGDLDALEADGKLRRTHGGAVSMSKALTVSIQDRRMNVNVTAKRAIATAAIELVDHGDAILVDSGTTALEFVRMLDRKRDVTVITADLTIANYIDESLPAVNAILLGGSVRKGHRYLFGPLAVRALDILHADKAFLCPTSLLPGRGLMTNFEQMAEVKAAMIAASRLHVALLDYTKIDAPGLIKFADVGDVDIVVMDQDPGRVMRDTLDALPEGAPRPRLIVAGAQ